MFVGGRVLLKATLTSLFTLKTYSCGRSGFPKFSRGRAVASIDASALMLTSTRCNGVTSVPGGRKVTLTGSPRKRACLATLGRLNGAGVFASVMTPRSCLPTFISSLCTCLSSNSGILIRCGVNGRRPRCLSGVGRTRAFSLASSGCTAM